MVISAAHKGEVSAIKENFLKWKLIKMSSTFNKKHIKQNIKEKYKRI